MKFTHRIGLSGHQYILCIKRNLDRLTSHSAKIAAACWHLGHNVNSAYQVITGSDKCPLEVRKRNFDDQNCNFLLKHTSFLRVGMPKVILRQRPNIYCFASDFEDNNTVQETL